MRTIRGIQRLRVLHRLIKNRNTGSPVELANRLGVSERTVYNMIEEMKMVGFPILYDKKAKTYFYEYTVELKFDLSITLLKDDESIEIFGGSKKSEKNTQTARLLQFKR